MEEHIQEDRQVEQSAHTRAVQPPPTNLGTEGRFPKVFQIRLLPQWMGFGQASFNPSILFCSGLCYSEGHVTALVGHLSLMGAAGGWQRSSMPLKLGWEICPWLSERWQLYISGSRVVDSPHSQLTRDIGAAMS